MVTIESFYALERTPFTRHVPPEACYLSPMLEEVLGRLQYAAERQWFAVVTGVCFVNSFSPEKASEYPQFSGEFFEERDPSAMGICSDQDTRRFEIAGDWRIHSSRRCFMSVAAHRILSSDLWGKPYLTPGCRPVKATPAGRPEAVLDGAVSGAFKIFAPQRIG